MRRWRSPTASGGDVGRALGIFVITCAVVVPLGPVRAAQVWPITRHDIQATIEPARSHLAVTDVIDLGPTPDPQQPLSLLLHRGLAVGVIELGKKKLAFEASTGFQPRHFWPKPDYERMNDYAIAREITIQPPKDGWPSQVRLTLRYAGAIYDSLKPPAVAYQRSFETTTGLIDARGSYLEGSTFWLPWSGDGLFRYRLQATVPPGWESVSQGDWDKRRTQSDGRVTSVWVVDDPMNEAYLIAGPYTVREATHGNVKIYTFTYAETPADLCQTYLDATGKYLDMYNTMIGPYPFGKFAMVENWWQTGYGMPSFTLLGDRVIRLPFIVHTSFGHEILHNWWGNGVFVDGTQGNWSEGLTSYLADYTYKEREGEAAARDYRLTQLQGYLDYASTGGRDFALRRFTERESPATQAVGYGKTMMVFHMARRQLGDDVFFAAIRRFYAENLFREAGWNEVVRCFEAVAGGAAAGGGVGAGSATAAEGSAEAGGRAAVGSAVAKGGVGTSGTVAAWFDQWLGRPGAPVLSVARATAPAGSQGGLWIELRQQPPVYDLRVPLRYEVAGEVRSRTVALHEASARVELEPGARWVAVDPDMELFRKLHRGEIPPALSQVLGADSTVVVIGARCSTALAEALRKLAQDWSRNHNQVVVDEKDFRGSGGRGVWLFGDGELVDRCFAQAQAFGAAPRELRASAVSQQRSLVASFRDPERDDIPWTVVLPADAAVVDALGRKLPHYGRYSFLVFDGETNVDKGSWQVESSPLRLDLTQ